MDIPKILAELKAERAQIEEAILSLERLALGRKRGPGRPRGPVNLGGMGEQSMADGDFDASSSGQKKRRGRPPGSKNKPRPAPPITATATSQ
jgi:hypothetical protein